jgi:hypothetical protein
MAENARPPGQWQLTSAEFFGSLSAEANVLWAMANIKKALAENPQQADSLLASFNKLTPVIESIRASARETAGALGLKTCASTVDGTPTPSSQQAAPTANSPPAVATSPTPPAATPSTDSTTVPVPNVQGSSQPPSAGPARGGETITSPSGFNHCHWYATIPHSASGESGVVCTSTAGSKNGYVVILTASGRRWTGYGAHRWLFAAGPRVAYGNSRSGYGIVCSSLMSGVRCVQPSSGHGIFVNTNLHGYFSTNAPGLISPR